MNDELNIKGVDYQLILDVANGIHCVAASSKIAYDDFKDQFNDEQKKEALRKMKNLLRFNDVLIKWLKENKIENIEES